MQYVICTAHTKVNLGNTTFISYCVNMFVHGHGKILSYIKLGRHVFFSTFQGPYKSSRQFLADAASQRSVVPPHKTVGPFIPNFVHGMIFFLWESNRTPLLQMTPRRIQLLSSSNNDPVALTPEGLSVLVALCEDISFGGYTASLQKGISCQSNCFDMRLESTGTVSCDQTAFGRKVQQSA